MFDDSTEEQGAYLPSRAERQEAEQVGKVELRKVKEAAGVLRPDVNYLRTIDTPNGVLRLIGDQDGVEGKPGFVQKIGMFTPDGKRIGGLFERRNPDGTSAGESPFVSDNFSAEVRAVLKSKGRERVSVFFDENKYDVVNPETQMGVGEFPLELQDKIRTNSYYKNRVGDKNVTDCTDINHLFNIHSLAGSFPYNQVCGGKFWASAQTDERFFAIQVKDDQGNALPPEQWQTFTVENRQGIPEDLQKWKESYKPQEKFMAATPDYDMVASAEGLKIVRKGEYDGEPVFLAKEMAEKDGKYAVSKTEPPVLYFMSASKPSEVKKMVMGKDVSEWKVDALVLPPGDEYAEASYLQVDPSGKFLVFQSEKGVQILDADTLQKRGEIPGVKMPSLDKDGKLMVIEDHPDQGNASMVTYEIDVQAPAPATPLEIANRLAN